jgi:hypothetical protein
MRSESWLNRNAFRSTTIMSIHLLWQSTRFIGWIRRSVIHFPVCLYNATTHVLSHCYNINYWVVFPSVCCLSSPQHLLLQLHPTRSGLAWASQIDLDLLDFRSNREVHELVTNLYSQATIQRWVNTCLQYHLSVSSNLRSKHMIGYYKLAMSGALRSRATTEL